MRYERRPDPIRRAILNYSIWLCDEVIGLAHAVIEPSLEFASLGYKTSPNFWGIGIGIKVFANLVVIVDKHYKISIFRAKVDSKNIESIKILRRNGFVEISSAPSILKIQKSTELIFSRHISSTDRIGK